MEMKSFLGLTIASVLSMAASGANAQSIVASTTNAVINETGHIATVVFTNDAARTYGAANFKLNYNAANLTAGTVTADDSGTACSTATAGVVLCFMTASGADTQLKPTVTITIPFDVGATAAVEPLTFSEVASYDGGGSALPIPSLTDGSITITAGPPPDVVVTFTPASGGTVAFGGGAPGDTSNGSIAVGNTGTNGTGTVNNCVLSGADAAAFSVVSGDPTTVPPAGSIALEATLGAAALTATLTCDVADSGGASTATWTLTAPAGTTLAAPTLGATPASGTPITLPTSTGTPVSSAIAIAPTAAGDTGGPAATLNCSSSSAAFTVTPASLTFAAGSTAGQNVMVGCTPGTDVEVGSVTCAGSDQSGAIDWSWEVSCPAAVDAPPAPTFIPATSLWSKLALFGVFAALGMLVLGLRRNH